eukprot:jgi/Tetstr1/451034/TSEL_038070.t1
MFGFELPVVFGAGILSFLSPCVLPLVPAYLTYMSGATFERLREEGVAGGRLYGRTLVTALAFVLGFSLIFIAFALALGPFLSFFDGFKKHLGTVEKVMGGLLVIVGILFLSGNFTRLAFWMQANFEVLNQFG